ncbi:hypothetical protein FEAC_09290 [Ferrimicrobium acidiphilum DSM 19497]|uniref:Uncharacterized protein n=1 Tax=Ferrimicrobium acidiphilum DSM 19497 TaxID=1121877 RepID=A0A0D8FY73_9ACTN|nr:hypothetical protein FEAC_09290 [Ferrimicrobium acidiphilum DSM 19497]
MPKELTSGHGGRLAPLIAFYLAIPINVFATTKHLGALIRLHLHSTGKVSTSGIVFGFATGHSVCGSRNIGIPRLLGLSLVAALV